MTGRPWYKRFPNDFLAATISLSLEEKGAYSVCLDLIYANDGPIPDDAQWIARACGCSTRKWKQLRERLLEAGKLYVDEGKIGNARADKQVENSRKNARKLAESGAKGALKTNEKKARFRENNALEEKRPTEKSRHTRSYMLEDKVKDSENNIKIVPADAGGRYAFEGKVVKLTPDDFDRWCKAYAGGDSEALRIALQQRDDWLSEEAPAAQRKKWFVSTSNWIGRAFRPGGPFSSRAPERPVEPNISPTQSFADVLAIGTKKALQ